MSIAKVFVPADSIALARGATATAEALVHEATQRGLEVDVIRSGSRGMFWLEPMLEVMGRKGQRIAYGPVQASDITGLLAADFLAGGNKHALCLGDTEEIDWLQRQHRLVTCRLGIVNPLSLNDYKANGGGQALAKARSMEARQILQEVSESGLRGRGGAAFPTGRKWQTVYNESAAQKYIVCNADEGDSGSYADRMMMEGDPFCLFEGMAIAGLAVGANKGYIYVRSEYPHAINALQTALANAADWLEGFGIEIRKGAASYVCGEETALLESIEGRRGLVRAKPPLPAVVGLFGCPTVVNNVISFCSVPDILINGGSAYRSLGFGRSRGTLPFQLAGNIKRAGLVEVPFGITLRELLYDFGGGSRSGRPLKAVQVGGPLGAHLPASLFETPLDYEAFSSLGATLGHGGIVAFDDSVNMAELARYAFEFCALESCGKCTPCRIGSVRGAELIDQLTACNDESERACHLGLLNELCDTMQHASLCAMGSMTPNPVRSAWQYFAEDF